MKNTSQGGEEKIEYLKKHINWPPEVLIFYGAILMVCLSVCVCRREMECILLFICMRGSLIQIPLLIGNMFFRDTLCIHLGRYKHIFLLKDDFRFKLDLKVHLAFSLP